MPDLSPFTPPPIFWLPDRLSEPNPWVGHIPFAFWLVDAHQPQTIVELGTHSGNSYLAFCQAVQTLQLETRCWAIDTWRGDEQAGFYGEEVFSELSGYHDTRYGGFSQLLRSRFEDAVKDFPDGSIDLLHIDGLHTYEAVKGDFEMWRGKLSDRAIVLFHDIEVCESDFGVWKLWKELGDRYPQFSFLHSYGLGVLGFGCDLSDPLRILFALDRDLAACEDIRGRFARLGNALIDTFALQTMREENARLAGRIKYLEASEREIHDRWIEYQVYGRRVHVELERSRELLKKYRDGYHRTRKAWEEAKIQLQQASEGWESAQNIVRWMETSFFWRLRELWIDNKPM